MPDDKEELALNLNGKKSKIRRTDFVRAKTGSGVSEKAAMLLYLVTKNHSFSDGNKRIAATLFLWFLHNNGILYREDSTKRIADNPLVALTLMIAENHTEEKDTMLKVVVNLIIQENG